MRAWNQNRLFNYVIPQVMKKNWLQTTANEIVIMVLIHLPNSKNLSNLIKSEFCPLFKLSLLVFLVSKIENLCCSVELPCVSYHWELSSIKISKISFFEFLDIFHQNQPECTFGGDCMSSKFCANQCFWLLSLLHAVLICT